MKKIRTSFFSKNHQRNKKNMLVHNKWHKKSKIKAILNPNKNVKAFSTSANFFKVQLQNHTISVNYYYRMINSTAQANHQSDNCTKNNNIPLRKLFNLKNLRQTISSQTKQKKFNNKKTLEAHRSTKNHFKDNCVKMKLITYAFLQNKIMTITMNKCHRIFHQLVVPCRLTMWQTYSPKSISQTLLNI